LFQKCPSESELEVAQLVAAERDAGQVVALDKNAWAVEVPGQIRRFDGRRGVIAMRTRGMRATLARMSAKRW